VQGLGVVGAGEVCEEGGVREVGEGSKAVGYHCFLQKGVEIEI